MNNSISEQERKDLNKKIIKSTFKNEINENKTHTTLISDFIFLFIALSLSKLFVRLSEVNYWFLEIAIAAIILIFLNLVRNKINEVRK